MPTTHIAKRILIIDDEPENTRALHRELRTWSTRRGVTIDTYTDPSAALDALAEREYGVVITDNRMPGIGGTELVRYIGKEYPGTVSILLTGYTEKRDVEAALSSGIFAFLIKPWDRDQLQMEVEKALNVHYIRKRHLETTRRAQEELHMAVEFRNQLMAFTLPERETGIVPSHAEVPAGTMGISGDYLDIIELTDAHYLVLIGDVSGHGLRTTFVTAMLKAILIPQYLATTGDSVSPSRLLSYLNNRVSEIITDFPDLFVAFSAAVVDSAAGTVTCASAGNPAPLLQRNGEIQEFPLFGIALGVQPEAEYCEATVDLNPGEAMYMFTDGIWLPKDGVDRVTRETLYQVLLDSVPSEPLDHVIEELRGIAGEEELDDDIATVRLAAV